MRASAIRMGVDPIEAIPSFRNVEQLFGVYDVPAELRPVLVRPFLNDKAKAVVGKLGPEVLGDYERLKAAVLKEFKLSPNVYLDRFNTYRKADSESYVAFASRLKGLLNYYLESRRVDDFDGLFELLICDRIKNSLSEACLRHVLSVENATVRGWYDVDALSDTADKYAACYNNNNRPLR